MKNFYKVNMKGYQSSENSSKLYHDIDQWKIEVPAQLVAGNSSKPRFSEDFIDSLLATQDAAGLWQLIVDDAIPESDIRVLSWYWPTYLATAILMQEFLIHSHDHKPLNPKHLDSLKRGLKAACGRKLSGHGLGAESDRADALNLYLAAGLAAFVSEQPDFAPEFTAMIKYVIDQMHFRLANGYVIDDYNDDFTDKWTSILRRYDGLKGVDDQMTSLQDKNVCSLFVYGSLMRGRPAYNRLLAQPGCTLLGEAVLPGYRLFDLGLYPAVLAMDESGHNAGGGPALVAGELYSIDAAAWPELDRYEGEGSLYDRRLVDVRLTGTDVKAWTYVYRLPIDASLEVEIGNQPWQAEKGHRLMDRYVWYAAYGSNCLKERFITYIEGGRFRNLPREHTGCRDRSHPLADDHFTIDLAMYFGNWSSTWQGGVCFLDLDQPGKTMGRVYLITREQLCDIQKQEGKNPNWYWTIHELGSHGGIQVLTLTNSERRPVGRPSTDYLQIVREGIVETYGLVVSENKIDDYLAAILQAGKKE